MTVAFSESKSALITPKQFVIPVGQVPSSELASYYALADIYILNSRKASNGDIEGFGISIIEAGMMSKPAIGSKGCGIEDAIVDGETGFLINADEPKSSSKRVIELLLNDKKSRKMGERGHARVTQAFTIEKMVDKTIAVYEDVLGISK